MSDEIQLSLDKLKAAQAALQSQSSNANNALQPWSQELVVILASVIVGFSLISMLTAAVLLWRCNAQPQDILRVLGILSIVGLSSLLMVIGYSNEQLTPIIGLFGAVAGYLLGRGADKDRAD